MTNINTETTVAEIVRAQPGRARVFERLGIDYCCGGKKPLAELCAGKGLNPANVLRLIGEFDAEQAAPPADVEAMSLARLCDHIESTHHGYLLEELPRLDFMTRKVAAVHGAKEPRLVQLRQVFETFNAQISSAIRSEHETLFPAIRQLDAPQRGAGLTRASLKLLLDRADAGNRNTGVVLESFKAATNDYTPPDWACNTFRSMYHRFARMAERMDANIDTETNVLFPRALEAA